MHLRSLGETGLRVSVLGMGSSPFRLGTPRICGQLLRQAVELGVTYYDTARSYENGEEAVAYLEPHLRDRLVIATKSGSRSGANCVSDLHKSLRVMKRDRIDLWMAHIIQNASEYEECTGLGGFCDVAEAARRAGVVRAVGASFHAPTALILRAIEERAFDVVMFQLNIIERETIYGAGIASYRETLIPAAKANGVGVVIMKALAGGELAQGAGRLDFVADPATGRDVAGGALRYATMHLDVATVVVGMRSTKELVRNVLAVEGVDDTFHSTFVEWTERVKELNTGECTRCGKCIESCPEKIEIPRIFRHHDQLRCFGMERAARGGYARLEVNASACSGCRRCRTVCPEDLDIEAGLQAAHRGLSEVYEESPDLSARGRP